MTVWNRPNRVSVFPTTALHEKKHSNSYFRTVLCQHRASSHLEHPHSFLARGHEAINHKGWKHSNWGVVNVQEQVPDRVLQEQQQHPLWAAEQGAVGQGPAHLLHGRSQRVLELGEGHREGELGQHRGQVVTPELAGEGVCQGRVTAGERQRHRSALQGCSG